ncbi:hypothetical protein NBM05_02785 [Rothia sp. AR01]|uniref:Uncharacterized protein n=1 Tax=Rothia santali TaxID=2949643 RepID=A0A9X2HHI4_9MICC|nr:DUF6578 domain-containing protein [Rothia santali]MCP3424983.1 hypothetical protein [Rothia santali]
MRIDVELAEWEQSCCGAPFGIGDSVVWIVRAVEPGTTSAVSAPPFVADLHGQTADGVPCLPVPGVVVGIAGIAWPRGRVPSSPGRVVRSEGPPRLTTLTRVRVGDPDGPDAFLVALEVPDDAELPVPLPGPRAP